MAATTLKRLDDTLNMARFYEVDLQPGLFGDVCVMRHWGRIGTHGQYKEYWFSTEDGAAMMARQVLHQKEKRGYKAVILDCVPGQARTAIS